MYDEIRLEVLHAAVGIQRREGVQIQRLIEKVAVRAAQTSAVQHCGEREVPLPGLQLLPRVRVVDVGCVVYVVRFALGGQAAHKADLQPQAAPEPFPGLRIGIPQPPQHGAHRVPARLQQAFPVGGDGTILLRVIQHQMADCVQMDGVDVPADKRLIHLSIDQSLLQQPGAALPAQVGSQAVQRLDVLHRLHIAAQRLHALLIADGMAAAQLRHGEQQVFQMVGLALGQDFLITGVVPRLEQAEHLLIQRHLRIHKPGRPPVLRGVRRQHPVPVDGGVEVIL